MSTRANFYVLLDETLVYQYYNHYDGYFKGLGNDLRTTILKVLGESTLTQELSLRDILLEELRINYEEENVSAVTQQNNLHPDIEYVYILDPITDRTTISLYGYSLKHFREFDKKTIKEVLESVMQNGTKFDLNKEIDEG